MLTLGGGAAGRVQGNNRVGHNGASAKGSGHVQLWIQYNTNMDEWVWLVSTESDEWVWLFVHGVSGCGLCCC